MAVELAELADRLRASLNVPGEEFFTFTDDQASLHLANAFWNARLRGHFAGYRVDADTETVIPEASNAGAPDLSDLEQQVIVAYGAYIAVENKLLSLTTNRRAKAGPVESETSRSAQLLRALLEAKRDELKEIREELVGSRRATSVAFIDAVLARHDQLAAGALAWVR